MKRFTATAMAVLISGAISGAQIPNIVQAATLDMNLNDSNVRAELDVSAPFSLGHPTLNISFGAHYHDDDSGEDTMLLSAGVHSQEQDQGYVLGVGLKGYSIHDDQFDGGALAIGVQGRMALELSDFRLGGHAYAAPSITTFSDIDGLLDISVRAYYRAVKNVDIYLGWSKTTLDLDKASSHSLDSRMNLGMMLSF